MTDEPPRATSAAPRVLPIDGLRGLGMLMVYLFHVREFTGMPAWRPGWLGGRTDVLWCVGNFGNGVDLFMVISGFCLFWPLCSRGTFEKLDLCRYFRRRVRRIVTPYYAAIVYTILLPVGLVALYHALHRAANWQPVPSLWQIATHVLFIHSMIPGTWNGITGAFWSLGLEAQFYVLFPLAVMAYRRYGARALWWSILGSVAFRILVACFVTSGPWGFILSISSPGRWMEFGFGMLTALSVAGHMREGRYNSAAVGTAQVLAGIAIYAAATMMNLPVSLASLPTYEVLLSIAFSLLVLGLCTSRTPLSRVFSNRAATWLGGISYSLYLLHQPTAWYFSEFLKKQMHVTGLTEFCILATAGFLIILAVGYPFYLVFERPGLKRNDGARRRPMDGAAVERGTTPHRNDAVMKNLAAHS